MVTCAECATPSPDESAFCGNCGAALGPKVEGPQTDKSSPRTVPESPISAAVRNEPAPAHGVVQILEPGPRAGAPLLGSAPAGSQPTQTKRLPPGTMIDGKYSIVRVLGEGGMGIVYLARDVNTGLDVVVKAIRSELAAHREDVRRRTLAEGRALAQIDHPNVVHLKAVAVEGPNLFLVMQYIDGDSLDRLIARYQERGERMPVEEALGVFRQVVAGIGAAHEEGVIHRDLKPANVLIRKKDGTAKVTDFGIAKVQNDSGRVQTRGIIGSLWYMSPEQVTGRRDLDRRVDIYALGIVLYQILVGHVPFDAKSDYEIMRLHAEAPMPRVSAVRADVAAGVDELIQKACAKDREKRFQSCAEILAAIDRLQARAPAVSTVPDPAEPDPDARPPEPTLDTGETAKAVTSAEDAPAQPADTSAEVAPEPQKKRRRVWPWVVLAIVLLAGGGVGAVAAGLVPGVKLPKMGRPHHRASASASASVPPPASADAKPKSPLEGLAGAWIGNGRELDAVLVGSDLEFRVKAPEQFAPQGYVAGEARFVLRAAGDVAVFTVEDRIRPLPPAGKAYDARSRGTCQEAWTAVGAEPLRARWDGTRLSIDFAKIEPGSANFTLEGARIIGCKGLRDLKASKVVSVLTRVPDKQPEKQP